MNIDTQHFNIRIKMFITCTSFSIFFLNALVVFAARPFPEISIDQGILRGSLETSQNNRKFYSFTDIPYAKPPIGWYRFEPPEPADKWDGVLDATQSLRMCTQLKQISQTDIIGIEDCLHLNVYTPQLLDVNKTLLPVMFYTHGGSFAIGSARKEVLGPNLLLDKDIVLVTINYRLGPFGFFSTGDSVVPGNTGLKDQAFALKWVKHNINRFGGDPKKITIFGHSSGGACAHYHMFSPLSRDLINGVIAQSGNVFNRWALMPSEIVHDNSIAVANAARCPKEDSREIVKCLKALPASDIMHATKTVMEQNPWNDQLFGPIIESDVNSAFLPKDPIDIITANEAVSVPFLTGVTSEDGAVVVAPLFNTSLVHMLNNIFDSIAPHIFFYSNASPEQQLRFNQAIREFYFQGDTIDSHKVQQLIKMCTDGIFLAGTHDCVNIHSRYSKQPVFYYLFSHRGSETYAKAIDGYDFGVTHGDELLYLFKDVSVFPNYVANEIDKKVSDVLTKLWTNFAYYGNPTPSEDDSISIKWKPVLPNQENYYHIKMNASVEPKEGLFTDRARFWTKLSVDTKRIKIREEL